MKELGEEVSSILNSMNVYSRKLALSKLGNQLEGLNAKLSTAKGSEVKETENLIELKKQEITATSQLFGVKADNIEQDFSILANLGTYIASYQKLISTIDGAVSAYESRMQAEEDADRKAELAAVSGIKREGARKKAEEDINKKYDDKAKNRAKNLRAWKVSSAISNVALGALQTYADPSILPSWLKIPIVAAQIAAGYQQVKAIQSEEFAQGGLIGGNLHSQGGTPIIAERGEFVMSRAAVNAVGVESMNRINEGLSGEPVTINFSGNVMSRDFIENDAIPRIKEAVRRGADIGIG